MTKELYVSSTPHETKVAIVEDDQLAEIYFERENEYTLAGSIYKGRVTRVLPGMQSAFVDIGLERDAFLYVSDFFEPEDEDEEFEPVMLPRPVEAQPQLEPVQETAPGPQPAFAPEQSEAAAAEPPAAPAEPQRPEASQDRDRGDRGGWRGRHRRRGRRGRGFPESKFARGPEQRGERPERTDRPERRDFGPPPGYQPIILPGESISKYQHLQPAAPQPHAEQEHEMPAEPLPASPEVEGEQQGPEALAEAETRVQAEGAMETTSAKVELEEDEHHRSQLASEQELALAEEAQRFERMNVASVFGGAEAARDNGADTLHEVESELPRTQEETASGSTVPLPEPQPHEYSASPAGTVEEEEIEEEEESDLPSVEEHLDDSDYEEVEEETIEPAGATGEREALAAGEATEAIEETDTEQAAEDELYEMEEDLEGDEEGQAERLAEEEVPEGAEGRAEVRAAAGTAGYQQRTARFERDRRGRGRRGGRRLRQRRDVQRQHVMISDILKEGQEVLIQIAKEPIGKKGARITSHIALPGRFLVYMPTVNHIGVSRKIQADEERQRLKRIVMSERENGHGGFIVRTAAEHVGEDDLRADIRFLKNLWSEIKNRADNSKAPALIYHDLNLVERVLRDQVTSDFATIWVDSEGEYERILRFANRFQPALVRKVKLYTKETPLFEQFGVQEEINKALKSKVWLKSGGYIVINQTEALVAIDVNTGKYVGKTARLEDTIVKTNVDAIKEIVRQIRLRDLGGIIVIDFIDMDERRNRQKVMQALDEELRHDRAPSKVLAFNDFGLVAITRKRVKQSLERTLGTPCPYCSATGFVKSVTTICNEIYTELRKMRRHLPEGDILLRVHPEVAKALKANGGRWQQELEEVTGRTVIVKSDPSLHQEQFDM